VKRAGIIGGLGPESTVEYYRLIGAAYKRRTGDTGFPPLLITSIVMARVLELARAGRAADLAALLLAEVNRLAAAGAEFAAISANTPHLAFPILRGISPIPLVSIVESVRDEALRLGLRRLALLGSRTTMEGAFFSDVMLPAGIRVVAPAPADRGVIDRLYFSELIEGVFRDETRAVFMEVVGRMQEFGGIDGVLLAGTELPLLLREPAYLGLPFLDSARIHAEAIVSAMLS
jgi:aspartate racemase